MSLEYKGSPTTTLSCFSAYTTLPCFAAPIGNIDADKVAKSLVGPRGAANLHQTNELNMFFSWPCFRDKKDSGLVWWVKTEDSETKERLRVQEVRGERLGRAAWSL